MMTPDSTGMGRRQFLSGIAGLLVGGRPSLASLGRRFRELRRRKQAEKPGHFDADLDGAGGELFRVMDDLGKRLGAARTPAARVESVMGGPDEKRADRWVYLWRGWHDYLFFTIDGDGLVVHAKWYMAGD